MSKLQMKVLIGLLLALSMTSFELYSQIKNGYEIKKRVEAEEGSAKPSDKKEGDKIELGIILTLSGVTSAKDNGALLGAELAVEKLNSEGGALGKDFSIVTFDNRGTQLGSRDAAKKAVERKVAGVIGPERSSYALSAAPVLQENKIPTITHLATHKDVTRIGDYIFRACYTDEYQGAELAKHAIDAMGTSKAVVLRMVDEDYSLELSRYFKDSYEALGGEVVWVGDYKSKDIEYSEIVLKAKEAKPDLIFIAGYTKDVGLIVRKARDLELDARFLSGDGIESTAYNFGGPAVNGLRSATHWHEDVDSKESREFKAKYVQEFKKSAVDGESVALSYDATMIIGEAIRRSKSLDGEAVKREISSTDNFKGVTGVYSFNQNGDPLGKKMIITEFKNGKREVVK